MTPATATRITGGSIVLLVAAGLLFIYNYGKGIAI